MTTPNVSPHFALKVDGKDFEVFMSFGLLNELSAMIGDPARAAIIFFDPPLRENVLRSALATRTKAGKVTAAVEEITDVEVDLGEIELLLSWIAGHVLRFFVRSVKSVALLEGDLKELAGLSSSLDGSKGSPSKKASVGRSAPRPAVSEKSTGATP